MATRSKIALIAACVAAAAASTDDRNVRDFGAKGDGKTLYTAAIQRRSGPKHLIYGMRRTTRQKPQR